ncbi:MAG: isopentenyl-diphosphate Delta-isomerase [Bacillota bacterium]|nr:isopentenyl-diphosphate Delta-isomerase [Bacillota bacterium]MDK2855738.1 isopentenyl-diphosphate Delta-isomerase [Bacillota bacterium]MDK2924682.1 isopentenyl-diphosphate Delta-isomerase [Bacillota bacterium]
MQRRREPLRAQRKNEHLRLVLSLTDGPGKTGFEDVLLLPEAVPDLAFLAIDLSTDFCGLELPFPILINALTGGTAEAARINARLAQVAKETGLPMAVGSQKIALEEPGLAYTFTIVRRINPEGVILANLSAASSPDEARRAVEMLAAQGLQLHLNAAQELTMPEGDRAFFWSDKIAAIVQSVPVPVIAKEVGSGLTGETAQRLLALGVRGLDLGGKGGTNFIAVEEARRGRKSLAFLNWGLPTAWSLLDILAACPEAEVCASGGLRTGLDMAKALALGARLCGVAAPLLRAVVSGGVKAGVALVERWKEELRFALALTGAKNLSELRRAPVILKGDTWHFAVQRRLTGYLNQRAR